MCITFGHANLLRDLNNLNLDIDLNERFGERVDLDKTRVDGTSETSKLGDETDVTLLDRLVWIRAADAARNRTKSTCLLYTSPSPRDGLLSRMPSSA